MGWTLLRVSGLRVWIDSGARWLRRLGEHRAGRVCSCAAVLVFAEDAGDGCGRDTGTPPSVVLAEQGTARRIWRYFRGSGVSSRDVWEESRRERRAPARTPAHQQPRPRPRPARQPLAAPDCHPAKSPCARVGSSIVPARSIIGSRARSHTFVRGRSSSSRTRCARPKPRPVRSCGAWRHASATGEAEGGLGDVRRWARGVWIARLGRLASRARPADGGGACRQDHLSYSCCVSRPHSSVLPS